MCADIQRAAPLLLLVMSKCGVIRDAMHAWQRGACNDTSSPVECEALKIAAKGTLLTNIKYNPLNMLTQNARTIRGAEMSALQSGIDVSKQKLAQKYGAAAPLDLNWWDFTGCQWYANGAPAGALHTANFSRTDITGAGYTPQPIIGGKLLAGTMPAAVIEYVPIRFDVVFNPDLAAALFFLILLLVALAVFCYWFLRSPPTRTKKQSRRIAVT